MHFILTQLLSLRQRPAFLALIAGSIFPLCLAPFNFWPAALVSIGLLFQLSKNLTPTQAARVGFLYGLGFFGTGVSWVYVSIHDFGGAGPILATFLTLLFSAGLALFFCAQSYLFKQLSGRSNTYSIAAFPVVWVLFEWFRSWFLTGFPWLFVGYAALENPLAGWAPVIGVYGCSLLITISAVALSQLIPKTFFKFEDATKDAAQTDTATPTAKNTQTTLTRIAWVFMAILPWLTGYALQQHDWVQPSPEEEISVALHL